MKALTYAESIRHRCRNRYMTRRTSTLVVLLAIAVPACGPGRDSTTTATAAAELSDLGACHEAGDVDFAPADDFIGRTVEWLEVDAEGTAMATALDDTERDATTEVPLRVRTVSGATTAASADFASRTIRLHGSLLEGLEWAQSHEGARVYAGLGGAEDGGKALFLLVVDAEGEFAFAGHCQSKGLTQPLVDRFDGDFGRMRDVIGRVGPDLTQALASPTLTSDTTAPVVLHPESVDQSVLDTLSLVTLEVDLPSTWAAPATLCSRIDEGWNDCLPLDGSITFPRGMTMYVGQDSTVEFWLMNEHADLTRPVQRLGRITIPDSSMEPGAARTVVRLTGDLASDGRSLEEASVRAS